MYLNNYQFLWTRPYSITIHNLFRVGILFLLASTTINDNSLCGYLFINSKAGEDWVTICGDLQETESVHPPDCDINTLASPPCANNLHTNIHIEVVYE